MLYVAVLVVTTGVLALVQVITAEPILRVPFAKQLNLEGSASLLRHDQVRAQALRSRTPTRLAGALAASPGINAPITNTLVTYVAAVKIGTPPTTYKLVVDTGSANTWIGADHAYVKTPSSNQTPNTVAVYYGSGSFGGTQFTDTVSLHPRLTIQKQAIGVANRSYGFVGIDGILGLGPTALTIGTLWPDTHSPVPTVIDSLYKQRKIPGNSIGVSFQPANSSHVTNGEMTYGGIDASKINGPLRYTTRPKPGPSSDFWDIEQSITYGSKQILPFTAGIVDTGTTLILLADDAFDRYRTATKAVMNESVGLLEITPAQFKKMKSLYFHINGASYELIPEAQIWPPALNKMIGGRHDSVYLMFGKLGTNTGQGFDFILGYTFLERFYVVFNTGNRRVGLAETKWTRSKFG